MDEDVLNRLSKFQLRENEAEGIVRELKDVSSRRSKCEGSLLGQIWGFKEANYIGLKNTLHKFWCKDGGLKTVELGPNFYQFIFSKNRVLLKRPWFFDYQILVLHPWTPQLKYGDECLNRALFWIHIRGLPYHWCSREGLENW